MLPGGGRLEGLEGVSLRRARGRQLEAGGEGPVLGLSRTYGRWGLRSRPWTDPGNRAVRCMDFWTPRAAERALWLPRGTRDQLLAVGGWPS